MSRWDIGELDRMQAGMIRYGVVIEVDPDAHRVRLDSGGLETEWMPWIASRVGDTVTWSCPSMGDQMAVFIPFNDSQQGFVIGGFYSDDRPPPSTDPLVTMIRFKDGSTVTYDAGENAMTVDVGSGSVTVNCAQATVNCEQTTVNASTKVELDTPLVHCTAALTVDGPITGTGGMAISGGSGGATATITGPMKINGNVETVGTFTNNGKDTGSGHRHANSGGSGTGGTPI